MTTTPTDCPGCGRRDPQRLGSLPDSDSFAGKPLAQPLPGGSLYRCRHCQLKFRHPVLGAATYDRLYDNASTESWPAEGSRPDWDLIAGCVREFVPRAGKVLDFGCYSGGLLGRLDPALQRYGVEVNRAAAALAVQRGSERVWPAIDDVPKDLKFDAVIAADVIEHMRDPKALIDRLQALLAADGVLILTTGDADNILWNRFGANWWYCANPEHLSFISRNWLDVICQASGLCVTRCEAFRYRRLGMPRRLADFALTCFYGLRPAAYIRVLFFFKKLLGRPLRPIVPGNGVSADHLLVVLSRKTEPEASAGAPELASAIQCGNAARDY